MITVIITAYKEERTVGKAIQAFLNQDYPEEIEILVACPDKETKAVIDQYTKKHKKFLKKFLITKTYPFGVYHLMTKTS